jgi:hypothetical protein
MHKYFPRSRKGIVRISCVVILVAVLVLLPLLTPSGVQQKPEFAAGPVKLSADQLVYRSNQRPEFRLQVPPAKADSALGMFGIAKVYAAKEQITTSVTYQGHKADIPVSVKYVKAGQYSLSLNPDGPIKPGSYNIDASIRTASGVVHTSQDFAWGVLAVNTTKPAYQPGEMATIQMAVLSSNGNTLCDAPLVLTVTAPDGSTSTPGIQKPSDCHADQYTEVPDYSASYQTGAAGTYTMKLQLADSDYTETDTFVVAAGLPFVIERTGPTRLFPSSPYKMEIKVTASEDFHGAVSETLPAGFTVPDTGSATLTPAPNDSRSESKSGPILTWQADWKAGESHSLTYTFKAPLVSPAFYFLKPLTFTSGGKQVYQETRAWQMAGDAVITWVKETSAWSQTALSTRTISTTSTAGNTLILFLMPRTNLGTLPQTFTISDSASNTWVVPPMPASSGAPTTNPPYAFQGAAGNYFMAYALNTAAITTFTVAQTNAINLTYSLVEFSNIASTGAVDQSNATGRSASGTQVTPTLTTTNANDLILGGVNMANANTMTISASSSPTSGWTQIYPTATFQGLFYQVVSSTGSYQITETVSDGATATGTGIMAFKAAAGCSPTTDELMRGGQSIAAGVDCGFFWAV